MVPSDQGAVVSPVSGRSVLTYRIDVSRRESGAGTQTSTLRPLFNLYATRAKTRQVLLLVSLAVTGVGALLMVLGIVL